MIDLSADEERQVDDVLAKMSFSLFSDKNRIAKAIAICLRNKLEDFHVEYLSDKQMRDFNPLIRNAIFTFLTDFGDEYSLVSVPSNKEMCTRYILKNTISYLKDQGIPPKGINEFICIVDESVSVSMRDLSNRGIMLAGCGFLVPQYWGDCVYCNNLNNGILKK